MKQPNKYALLNFKARWHSSEIQSFQPVTFYELREDGSFDNGTTLEEMLRVSIERLQDLDGRFACRENSIVITKMQEALMWLNARTANREKRGVEGKLQQ